MLDMSVFVRSCVRLRVCCKLVRVWFSKSLFLFFFLCPVQKTPSVVQCHWQQQWRKLGVVDFSLYVLPFSVCLPVHYSHTSDNTGFVYIVTIVLCHSLDLSTFTAMFFWLLNRLQFIWFASLALKIQAVEILTPLNTTSSWVHQLPISVSVSVSTYLRQKRMSQPVCFPWLFGATRYI